MNGFAVAAGRTFREIVRARSLAGLVVFLLLLAWASLFAGSLTIGSRVGTAVDLALAASALFAAATAVLLAVEHIGAAALPASWPLLAAGVSRSAMLGGRWLGVVVVACAVAAAPPLLVGQALPFLPLGANEDAAARTVAEADLALAALLLPLEALLVVSITGALAVAFPRAVAVALAAGIWAAGHLHPDPLTFVILYPGWPGVLLRTVGAILPDLELYNARVVGGDLDLIASAAWQTLITTAGALGTAWLAYRARDL